jgi:hypothetical protein
MPCHHRGVTRVWRVVDERIKAAAEPGTSLAGAQSGEVKASEVP